MRHDIINGLAMIEVAGCNKDIAVITEAELLINQMVESHTQSCCNCTEASRSSYNVITWDNLKQASREDEDIQDLVKLIAVGFPEDARSLPAQLKPYNMYKSSLYVVDEVVMLGEQCLEWNKMVQNDTNEHRRARTSTNLHEHIFKYISYI